jgi:hypothetical protein
MLSNIAKPFLAGGNVSGMLMCVPCIYKRALPCDALRARNSADPHVDTASSGGRVFAAVLQSPSRRVGQRLGEIGGRP